MRNATWWLLAASVAASSCGVDGDDAGEPEAIEQASSSYHPMGFARVTAGGGLTTQFNSTGGAVTVSHSLGSYSVGFAGLGIPVGASASGGHFQVTAEGATNVRCRITSWGGSPTVSAGVQCTTPAGALADTPFAIVYFRYGFPPAPNGFSTSMAYAWVQASGAVDPAYDYNGSGVHNTVTKTGAGSYTVNITNAAFANASMMVTPYGAGNSACSVVAWGTSIALVSCRNSAGALADTAFTFSYSLSGPTLDQQGAHAWFDGTSAPAGYAAAVGKVSWCSPASVTGSRSGSLATMVVSGDLGSWTGMPFLRTSFATKYSGAGYCKVESLTSSGVAPASTGTTTVRCYDATGAVVATPQFAFTHITGDPMGPC